MTNINSGLISYISATVIVLAMSIIVVYFLTPYGSATTPDSLRYLDIAGNIYSGSGIVETDFSLDYLKRKNFKSQKLWPPLYPIALSFSASNKPTAISSSYLSIFLLFVSALLAFLIQERYIKWYLALLSSVMLCLTIPMLIVYTYTWSETLFIPLLLLAFWSAIRYLDTQNDPGHIQYFYLGLLILVLILLAYTRYIGIVFSVFILIIYMLSNNKHKAIVPLLAASTVYLVLVGLLLVSNYFETGSVSGAHRTTSVKNFIENIIDGYLAVKALVNYSPFVVLASLLCTALLIPAIRLLFNRKDTSDTKAIHNFYSIISLVCGTYIIAIIGLRSIKEFDDLDVRLISPVFPLLWMLAFMYSVSFINRSKGTTYIIQYYVLFFIIFLSFSGIAQFHTAINNWQNYGTPGYLARGNQQYPNFTYDQNRNSATTIFSKIVPQGAVIVTDNPMTIEYTSGVRCLQKPDVINSDTLNKLNQLPRGSLLLLEKENYKNIFTALNEKYSTNYEYSDLGSRIAVRIPVRIYQK
jgi:hypothetical protein